MTAAEPSAPDQHELLRLQQLAGNQAVVRLLRAVAEERRDETPLTSAPATTIQRKPRFLKKIGKGLGKLRNLVKPRKKKASTAAMEEPLDEAMPVQIETAAVEQVEEVVETDEAAVTSPDQQVLVDMPTEGLRVVGDVLYVDGTAYSLKPQGLKGLGSFGKVYEILPLLPGSGPPLALKLPDNEDDELGESFRNETETAMALGEHPNLAKTFGMLTVDSPETKDAVRRDLGARMVISELLAGGTLSTWVGYIGSAEGGLLGRALRAEKAGITYREYVGVNQYIENEIVKALKHMHEQGFGHFDIKPENVMFDGDFNVKVIDLGGATRFGSTGAAPLTTRSWWSPEWAAAPATDKSSAVTEAYDAYGMGLWSNKALAEVRGLKDPKHGPPAPGAGNQQGPQLASEQYVGAAMSTDPSRRTIAELADRAYLVDPLIDADEARAVLRFVKQWESNATLSYRAAPSPREEVPEPDPGAPMPARAPLPFLGQLLERAMARGEVELQAQVPQPLLETVGSTEEDERPPV